MITTLVVDDDFRVARIHSAYVNAVDGFTSVGEAHTGESARHMVSELRPELLLLDIYLPDEDGLSVLRSITAGLDTPPDTIVITAARDLQTVRAAMGLGAVYYLVKPFGMQQLQDQLLSYRRWRDELLTAQSAEADQAIVDQLYAMRQAPRDRAEATTLAPTMQRVLQVVRESGRPLTASAVAGAVGISRPTAQRYLTSLERRSLVTLHLEYGSAGRPAHLYSAATEPPGGSRRTTGLGGPDSPPRRRP